jgi:hypothetical protein
MFKSMKLKREQRRLEREKQALELMDSVKITPAMVEWAKAEQGNIHEESKPRFTKLVQNILQLPVPLSQLEDVPPFSTQELDRSDEIDSAVRLTKDPATQSEGNTLLKGLCEKYPSRYEPYTSLATALNAQGKLGEGERYLVRHLPVVGLKSQLLVVLGALHAAAKNHLKASAYFLAAVSVSRTQLETVDKRSFLYLAEIYHACGFKSAANWCWKVSGARLPDELRASIPSAISSNYKIRKLVENAWDSFLGEKIKHYLKKDQPESPQVEGVVNKLDQLLEMTSGIPPVKESGGASEVDSQKIEELLAAGKEVIDMLHNLFPASEPPVSVPASAPRKDRSQDWLKKAWEMNPDAPACFQCDKSLDGGGSLLDDRGGKIFTFGATTGSAADMRQRYRLFMGTVCFDCLAVFCSECVGEPIDRCPQCGGATKPAYNRELLELRGQAGAKRVASFINKHAATASADLQVGDGPGSLVEIYRTEILRFLRSPRTKDHEQQTDAWWTIGDLQLILAKAGLMEDHGELFAPCAEKSIQSLLEQGLITSNGTGFRSASASYP